MGVALSGCSSVRDKGESKELGIRADRVISRTLLGNVARVAATVAAPLAGKSTGKEMEARRKTNQIGTFENEVTLVPIAPNLTWFEQAEEENDRFGFITQTPCHGVDAPWKIVPEDMFFDGASIPRFLWEVDSLGPFDFTLAAVIHDWVFEAHHRAVTIEAARAKIDEALKDGVTLTTESGKTLSLSDLRQIQPVFSDLHDRYARYQSITLDDAATIYAECIYREMLKAEAQYAFLKTVEERRKADRKRGEAGEVLKGDLEKGIGRLKKAVDIARDRRFVLGYHRWAVRSFIAKRTYDPKKKVGGVLEEAHATTPTTVIALLEAGRVAEKEGADISALISPALLKRFKKAAEFTSKSVAKMTTRSGREFGVPSREAIQRDSVATSIAIEAAIEIIRAY